ncbi:hypothetical protein TNCV_2867981 [Trichonephila clavipes]|nr:hypothetical protein TNCV_2867981 [Trichonephila clavipes]
MSKVKKGNYLIILSRNSCGHGSEWSWPCDEAGHFPLITTDPLPTNVARIPDFSLIAGKEFRNWVLGVTKRRSNNVTPILVTTARLKTYSVHPDIGAHGAKDKMCRDRRGWQRDNRSKELRPTRRQKKKRSREQSPTGAAKGQNIRRRIRLDGMRESGYKGSERVRGKRIEIWWVRW